MIGDNKASIQAGKRMKNSVLLIGLLMCGAQIQAAEISDGNHFHHQMLEILFCDGST